ncbi:uncharacterized protein BKCO1_1800042 [Diplodia corticola]|uniref:Uncharacterized protein n=1 Tax=Diplodia corticola TaxID=236234 RepID=A0A1J9R3L8_9PEZI|nr:uncharacterized protein BKCO1_1800042 [Diplodia corticola]OJD35208.1 hypothetical protein BKCO1_1800042 [Diplodia corticola]
MCKATTYLYSCGGAFHTISTCDKKCYAGDSPSSPHGQSRRSPRGSMEDHPDHNNTTSPPTSTSSTATEAAPPTRTTTSTSTSSAGARTRTTGFHSINNNNNQHGHATTTDSPTTKTFTPFATPVNPHPRPLHIYTLPDSLAPSKTVSPTHATRVLRAGLHHRRYPPPPQAARRGPSALRKWFVSNVFTSWLFRRSKGGGGGAAGGRVLKGDAEGEGEVRVVWQDAVEVRRRGVERVAVEVRGECRVCVEREARDTAWAAMAEFRGED